MRHREFYYINNCLKLQPCTSRNNQLNNKKANTSYKNIKNEWRSRDVKKYTNKEGRDDGMNMNDDIECKITPASYGSKIIAGN